MGNNKEEEKERNFFPLSRLFRFTFVLLLVLLVSCTKKQSEHADGDSGNKRIIKSPIETIINIRTLTYLVFTTEKLARSFY